MKGPLLLKRTPVDAERLLEELARSRDLERRSVLTRTLRALFAAGGNASEAADRMFLHRNSMLYRLERVRKLTGLDLKDSRVALALQLGLLTLEKKEEPDET
jgi:DNA-binding PucR family transcriptional regulator